MDLSQTALPPSKSRVLFISYDGLTDPLGSSQILPYLRLIRKSGRSLHILSFEKGDRYVKYGKKMHTLLRELNIGWHPLRFSTRPRYLAKAWDLAKMYTMLYG